MKILFGLFHSVNHYRISDVTLHKVGLLLYALGIYSILLVEPALLSDQVDFFLLVGHI